MAYFHPTILCCFAFAFASYGLSYSSADSPCGGWTPYNNEECIKLVDQSGLQTKEDGEIICKAFAEQFGGEEIPKLITIKTEEKQTFLQNLLFEDLRDLDNVWLGLDLGKDNEFHWNDETDLLFTNWVEEARNETERRCVQMESGEGVSERGKWVRVNCKKRNAVVCQRNQPWTLVTLRNNFLKLKLDVATIKEEADQKIRKSNLKISEANQEIANLKQNPVPIGFVYVQLPDEDTPTTLWPQTSWKNVGSQYAGLFFRLEGGDAAPFGQLQEDNTRRLAQVDYSSDIPGAGDKNIPSDGTWSEYTSAGTRGPGTLHGIRFRLTTGEVRPRNIAVKIWQRIN